MPIKTGRQCLKGLPTIKEIKEHLKHDSEINAIHENWYYVVYTMYGIYCYNS